MRDSREIDLVRWQYSGNAHDVIRGVGLLNCIYVKPETEQFWIIDYWIFDPDHDGKTKVEHVKDMLNNVMHHQTLAFKTVLMDRKKICATRWYVEQFHREIKQVTGIEKCPCRKQRIPRNHIACAICAWIFLKKIAYKTQQTVYQLKHDLLHEYVVRKLACPTLKISFS